MQSIWEGNVEGDTGKNAVVDDLNTRRNRESGQAVRCNSKKGISIRQHSSGLVGKLAGKAPESGTLAEYSSAYVSNRLRDIYFFQLFIMTENIITNGL